MKTFFKALFAVFSLVFIFYLLLPTPSFPEPPPDALQSDEPADLEDSLRRGYFTDLSRQEVLEHYQKEFNKSPLGNFSLPTYRLNYPPEEAQTRIRDQTRSTFLEEIVHPFRESLFINGFEPKVAKDVIVIEDKTWRQKIIVKYVQSKTSIRMIAGIATLVLACILFREWGKEFK